MGFKPFPSLKNISDLSKGFEVKIKKHKKRNRIVVWTPTATFLKDMSKCFPNQLIRAPKKESNRTHNSIEPSWLPQVPVILYIKGFDVCEFCQTVIREKSEIKKPYTSDKKEISKMKKIIDDKLNVNFSKFNQLLIYPRADIKIVKLDKVKANNKDKCPISIIIKNSIICRVLYMFHLFLIFQ